MTCSIEGCTTKHYARSWCQRHYNRWHDRGGDPAVPRQSPNGSGILERMEKFVDKTDTCWLWLGATDRDGYGHVQIGGRLRVAHRAVYEALVGSIPDGLELDHLCFVRGCVNPKHLEPVTGAENKRRAALAASV